MMCHCWESNNALVDKKQSLEQLPGESHRVKEDPLYKLFPHKAQGTVLNNLVFVPCNQITTATDQSEVDLRHSIANMVAMVIKCPPYSNHLWFHMFDPDKLVNTYMTGFLVHVIYCACVHETVRERCRETKMGEINME